jgi:hypothetical protein
MEKAVRGSPESRRRRRAITKISARMRALEIEMRSQRQLLCEIREMWEDRLLLHRPVTPALANRILIRRYAICCTEEIRLWDLILIKWRDANELRGLLSGAPPVTRERFFALLSRVLKRDCIQHILEHHPLTADQQRSLDILTAAWHREGELRDLLGKSGSRSVERFIALIRLGLAAGEFLARPSTFEPRIEQKSDQ